MTWFSVLLLTISLQFSQLGPSDLRQKSAPNFDVRDVSAIRALLDLSKTQDIPLGIIEDDQLLCTTRVTYTAKNDSIATITEKIVAQVPGYKWTFDSEFSVIVISPKSLRPVTTQFLNLTPPHFGPTKGSPQMLISMLWVHLRALLHPQEGTAVSVISSPDAQVFTVETENETLSHVLNRIAIMTRGTWVLRPIPSSLTRAGAEIPFSIFSAAGSSASEQVDLCQPILGSQQ